MSKKSENIKEEVVEKRELKVSDIFEVKLDEEGKVLINVASNVRISDGVQLLLNEFVDNYENIVKTNVLMQELSSGILKSFHNIRQTINTTETFVSQFIGQEEKETKEDSKDIQTSNEEKEA